MEKKQTPQQRYNKKNLVRVSIDINKKTETDLLQIFSACTNKNGYIKALIRADKEIIKEFSK